jgi:hypothetical protein
VSELLGAVETEDEYLGTSNLLEVAGVGRARRELLEREVTGPSTRADEADVTVRAR